MTFNFNMLIILILSFLSLVSLTIGILLDYHNLFYISAFFILLTLFWVIYYKEKFKKELDLLRNDIKIKEEEINKKNIQIKVQDEEILNQVKFLKEQGMQIHAQKIEIENTIKYAFKVQQAILPSLYFIDKILKEYFIFYAPKAVVSGDFYYIEQINDYIIVAVIDCAGYGVQGAMATFIAYNILNQAVKINKLTKPSEILNFIDNSLTSFNYQINNGSKTNDEMDVSIISIHKFHHLVEYAAAYHKSYYTHKGKIFEIKGDKLPIGVNFDGLSYIYTNQAIPVSKGDMIYMFSNGYTNQFGGPHNKRFKNSQFKNLLLEISALPASEQKEILASTFVKWKTNNEQIDDVTIVGIRI